MRLSEAPQLCRMLRSRTGGVVSVERVNSSDEWKRIRREPKPLIDAAPPRRPRKPGRRDCDQDRGEPPSHFPLVSEPALRRVLDPAPRMHPERASLFGGTRQLALTLVAGRAGTRRVATGVLLGSQDDGALMRPRP